MDDEATVASDRTDADADANGSDGDVVHSPEQYVEDTAAPDDFGDEGGERDREPSPDQLVTPQRHTGSSQWIYLFIFANSLLFVCSILHACACQQCCQMAHSPTPVGVRGSVGARTTLPIDVGEDVF
jgi:hypothetical protein